jgi:Domain of Unknown Function (DUF1206)
MTLSDAPQLPVLAHDRRNVGRFGRNAAPKTWIERLSRLGFVIRGIIYFVPGVFALEWALGRHGQPMSQASAIDVIGRQPWGRVLLVVVAVGLAGYAAWGVIRAIYDPLRRGHSPVGIALRIGYAASAIAYLGLLAATIGLLTGSLSQAGQHQDWTVWLLARPFGAVIVVAVGLCWIFGSGITQIVMGWRHTFERDLALDRMSRNERRWAIALGRVGLVSRGIVFTIIGLLIVAAAFHLRSRSDTGLEGALLELAHQPFGHALLGAAGLGLMVFGSYSAMCARWMRMHPIAGDPGSSSSHPHSS